MIKSMLISIIMGMMKSIITKMIIMSIIRSIMNMIRLGIRISIMRVKSSKNKIIRMMRLEMGRLMRLFVRLNSITISITIHILITFSSPSTRASSQLKSSSSALLAVLLFLRPVLPNISMTTSRLTLPLVTDTVLV